jgi:hypothetical protein
MNGYGCHDRPPAGYRVRGQRLLIADLFGPHGNAKAAAARLKPAAPVVFHIYR